MFRLRFAKAPHSGRPGVSQNSSFVPKPNASFVWLDHYGKYLEIKHLHKKPKATHTFTTHLTWVLLVCVFAALFIGTGIAQNSDQTYQLPEHFKAIAENDSFQLFVNESTLAIKVLDKASGKFWHSNLDEVTEDDKLNKTWTAFAMSGISIDYLNQSAKHTRASLSNTPQQIQVTPIDQGFEAVVEFLEPSIQLRLSVVLGPKGITLDIPFESMQEKDPRFKLELLHLYPFFGASKEDQTPGYMFIPDGSGTLIPFAKSTKAKNVFYGRYYGPDLGMITKLSQDPNSNRPYKLSLPVSGMSHQSQGFVTIVEKGAPYGELVVHPAGIITRFNFLYNSFIYNQIYFQATNRSGDGLNIIQPRTNAFDIRVHYRFLRDQGDYVAMARSYQEYLLEQGVLQKQPDTHKDIGLRLEFLGSEKESLLFWQRAIPMTTLSQMQAILDDIALTPLEVVYYGWQPLGASSQTPNRLRLEPALGKQQELETLASTIADNGGHFLLYLNPQTAFKSARGYMARRDLAMSITRANLEGIERNTPSYYFNLEALQRRYQNLSQDLASLQAGWALDGISSMLYSDFKGNLLNREAAIQAYQALLKDSKSALYMPNDYMLGHARAYFDMPLEDSGYVYTSQSVPFLQVVLSGYIPYYARALNFSSNMRYDLLKHAEFGAYPSYVLTHEGSANILKTGSSWIYTSSYAQWQDAIKQDYQWLNQRLAPVKGASITAHQTLAPGVVATTYSNGQQIIVNYNPTPFDIDDLTIAGQDAIVREVSP